MKKLIYFMYLMIYSSAAFAQFDVDVQDYPFGGIDYQVNEDGSVYYFGVFTEDFQFKDTLLRYRIWNLGDSVNNHQYNFCIFKFGQETTPEFITRVEHHRYTPFTDIVNNKLFAIKGVEDDSISYDWLCIYDLKSGDLLKEKCINPKYPKSPGLRPMSISVDQDESFVILYLTDRDFTIKLHGETYEYKKKDYRYNDPHFLAHYDSSGTLDTFYFAYSEALQTSSYSNHIHKKMYKTGDTVYLMEGTYQLPGLEFPENRIYPSVGYTGFLAQYINGEYVSHNFNLLQDTINDPQSPWYQEHITTLSVSNTFTPDYSNRQFIANTMNGISTFQMGNVDSVNWNTHHKDWNGKFVPMTNDRSRAPFLRKNGLLYNIMEVSQNPNDVDAVKWFQNKYNEADMVLVTLDPKTGKKLRHEKIAEHCYGCEAYVFGEDGDGNLWVELMTGQYYTHRERYKYVKFNGKKYKTGQPYLIKLERQKEQTKFLEWGHKSDCYNAKALLLNKPYRQYDSVVVNWGDGQRISYYRQHKFGHQYAQAGAYKVDYSIYNLPYRLSYSINVDMPMIDKTLTRDTIFYKDTGSVKLPTAAGISYRWHNGSTDPNFTFTEDGYYRYTASYDSCRHVDSFYALEVEDLSVLAKNAISAQFFPNPAGNVLHYRLQSESQQAFQFKLYDMHGRLLRNERLNSKGSIDISTVKSGLYLIEIQQGQHHYRQKLFKD